MGEITMCNEDKIGTLHWVPKRGNKMDMELVTVTRQDHDSNNAFEKYKFPNYCRWHSHGTSELQILVETSKQE
jgi:hypothetical protein